MPDEIIKSIADVVRKHLKVMCKELTKESEYTYSVKECSMKAGKVYFAILYKHNNNNITGCQTLVEKEMEVKDVNITAIKKRFQTKKQIE